MQQENQDLKSKTKEMMSINEQEKLEIIMNQKETELCMKQQKVYYEGEKLKLQGTIQKLESELLNLNNSAKLKNYEKQTLNDTQKNQMLDLQKNFSIEKEELISENKRLRENSEKAIFELKKLYEAENEGLRNTIKDLQKKMRRHVSTIEELKEQSSEFMELKNEELVNQVEYYKELYLNLAKANQNQKNSFDNAEKIKLLNAIENSNMQKNNLMMENERLVLENKKFKNEFNKNQEKYWETERNLKNEIKILIGKLMIANSKLEGEADLKETQKKEVLSSRSNSSSRYRKTPSYY